MEINPQTLTDQEKNDYESLAKALGIQTEELLSLDFYNENLFDERGEINEIKYVFSKENPSAILQKINGLSDNNTVIISATELNYNS